MKIETKFDTNQIVDVNIYNGTNFVNQVCQIVEINLYVKMNQEYEVWYLCRDERQIDHACKESEIEGGTHEN